MRKLLQMPIAWVHRLMGMIGLVVMTTLTFAQTTPTTDLTAHVQSGTLTAGTSLEWHSALPASAANLLTITQSQSAVVGVYYAVYNYGGSPVCYSSPTTLRILTNTCPATSVDLLTAVDYTTIPASATVTLHSSATAGAANELTSSTVTASNTATTYYAAYKTYEASTNTYCYSGAVPIVVVATTCCANPAVGGIAGYLGGAVCPTSNAGTITLSGQTGTVVKWQTSTNGGTTWTDIASTAGNNYYTFYNALNNQQYRAVVNTGVAGCGDAFSNAITISTSNAACTSASCDKTAGTIAFGATPAVSGSNYSTQMVLTNASGMIQYVSSLNSTSVTGVSAGDYFVYQVTYDNTVSPLPTISTGISLSAIGGSCVAVSNQLAVKVCATSLPPITKPDIATTSINKPVTGNVLTNDTDPNGGTLTASLLNQPVSGTVTMNLDGSYTYTPPTNFTGVVSFCYSATNTAGLSSSACVTVNVLPDPSPINNNPPVANNDNSQVTAGQSVTINVAANDTDPDSVTSLNGQLNTPVLGTPSVGTASLNPDGTVKYTAPANFTGVVTLPYTICDKGTPPLCSSALVTINVQSTPPVGTTLSPIAGDDALLTTKNTPKTGTVAANDSDPQGLTLTYATGQPASGTVIMSTTGAYTYTPPTGFVGPTSFTYSVCNTAGKCAVATVNVDVLPVDSPPVIIGEPLVTDKGKPGTICLPIIDPDAGDTHTATVCGQPAIGTVTLSVNNITHAVCLTYTPTSTFDGPTTVCVQVCDAAGLCTTTIVPITVIPTSPTATTPKPPIVVVDPIVTTKGTPVTVCMAIVDPNTGDTHSVTVCNSPAKGTATASVNNATHTVCVVYTPNSTSVGPDAVCLTVCDQTGLCTTVTVPVTITDPGSLTGTTPKPPVVTPTPIVTTVGKPVTVCTGITDTPTDSHTASICGQPASGTAQVGVDNVTHALCVTYTPGSTAPLTTTVCVQVCDQTGLCTTVILPITVLPVNQPPIATPDINNTNINTPVSGNVLTNDSDPQGGLLTATLLNQPVNGTVVLNPNGSYTYTPPTGFTGVVSFCYSVSNTAALSSTACVTINVNPVPSPLANDKPIANNDNTQTTMGTSVTINVAANDTDPDSATTLNGQLSAPTLVSQPSTGTASIVNGQVVYTPPATFTGVVSFPYSICDKATPALCATAVVTVNVLPAPPASTTLAPVAVDDALVTTQNTPKTGTVAANDSDPQGLTLTYASGQPTSGVVVMSPTGSYTYTPAPGYVGPDSFTYTVCNTAGKCDVATVSIDVLPAQDPPVVIPIPLVTDKGKPGTICLPITDPNVGDTHTVSVCGQPVSGTATVSVNNITHVVCLTYTPTSTFDGPTTVCVQVCDQSGLCTTVIVPITVIPTSPTATTPKPPIVVVDPIVTTKGTPVTLCMPITDPNLTDTHSVTVCNSPAKGTATASVNNATHTVCVVYTPNSTSVGPDAVCLTVCDQTGLCTTVTVPVTITDPGSLTGTTPKPPVVTPTPIVTTVGKPVTVCTGITDTPTDSHTASICGQPASGTAQVGVDNVTHALCVTYTPGSSPVSTTVCVQICDQTGLCTTVILPITVLPINLPPILTPDIANTNIDKPVSGNVLTNDNDPQGGPLTVSLLSPPVSGTVLLNSDGTYIYTPPTGFTGVASFCYSATNTAGLSASTCVTINVNPNPSLILNNRPIANNDATQTTAGVSVTINMAANDTDPDSATSLNGQLSNPTLVTQPSTGIVVVNANGTMTYTPPANFTGVVTFPYQVCDKATPALCATAVVTVTVLPTPQAGITLPPVAVDDALVTSLNTPKTGTVAANDSDPQGLTLTYASGQPTSGVVVMSPTGSYTYTPAPGYVGPDSFTYTVCNSAGKCDVATVSVDVQTSCILPALDFTDVNAFDPITCGGSDGYILVTSVPISTNITVTYRKNGVTQTYAGLSDVNGTLTIPNLGPGSYDLFSYQTATCVSNPYTGTVVVGNGPTLPAIIAGNLSKTNPASCASATGSILVSGLTASTSYTISYSKNGGAIQKIAVTTSASGQASLSALTAGTYSGFVYQQNASCLSAPSSATLTLTDPAGPILAQTQLSGSNPTSCGTSTGSLSLSGLTASTSYTIGYSKNGGTAQTAVLTSNASGLISLTGLGQGGYQITSLGTNNCTSALSLSAITLTDPAGPVLAQNQVTGSNPTSCGGSNGSVALTGLSASTSYSVTYSKNGGAAQTVLLTSNASGIVSLTGLTQGSYQVTGLGTNNCSSALSLSAISLSDPGATPLTAANVVGLNPATCGASTGMLSVTGLTASTSYTLSYVQDGGSPIVVVLTSTASGVISVTGLPTGSYTNLALTNSARCTSTPFAGTIVLSDVTLPTPTLATLSGTNLSCAGSGSDGKLTLTGLVPGQVYVFHYQILGLSKAANLTATASGQISVTGLSAGSYSQFFISQSSCISGIYAGPISLTSTCSPNCPTLTFDDVNAFDPTACGLTDGYILVTGLPLSTSVAVLYQKNGVVATYSGSSDANGTLLIPNLGTGNYSQFSYTTASCSSGIYSGTVVINSGTGNPALATNKLGKTNPTSCGTTTGSISLSGLTASTSYTIGYSKNGGATQTAVATANASGVVSVTGLMQGSYSGFTYMSTAGCPSAPASATLVLTDPNGPALAQNQVSGTNPTGCGTSTGSINLSGLTASTSYSVVYSKNGGATQTVVLASNASGLVSLTGLSQGSYQITSLGTNNCTSAMSLSAIALSDPAGPALAQSQLTGSNPTSCGGSNGSVALSGLTTSTSYSVTYSKNGGTAQTVVLTSSATGVVSLTGLSQGSYQLTGFGTNNCSSVLSLSAISLSDPAGPALAQTQVSGSNPASCGSSTGSVSLSGLTASTSYTIGYSKNGGTAQTVVLTSSASGLVSLTGLGQGSYQITSLGTNNCSAGLSLSAIVLSDPAAPALTAANLLPINPVSCGTATGSFSLTGLTANATYIISYQKDGGAAQTVTLTSNAGGVLSLTGLSTGSYSNFVLTNGAGCASTALAGPFDLSNPTLPTPTVSTLHGINAGCMGNDGKLQLDNLAVGQVFVFHYQLGGLAKAMQGTVNASGVLSVTGLSAGVYSDFFITQGICKSGTYPGPITINAICQPPVATPDIANTNVGKPVTGNVLTNDTDPGGLPLTASLLNQPISGTVTMNLDGTYTYTPPTNFTGVVNFCYVATNTSGLSSTACVTVNVNPVPSPGNNPPVANNDATQTTAGVSVTINVVANDTDPDPATTLAGQLSNPTILAQPSSGTVTVVNGQVVFTPPANFTGVASFPYQICDKATPALCATAVVTVNVQPTPPVGTTLAPVAIDDALLTYVNVPKTGTVAGNDSDPQGLTLTYTTGQPASGTVLMSPTGSYTYTPPTGFVGPTSFTYSVCNTAGKCDVATVSVDVLPSLLPPVATPDIANTNQNTPVTGNVLTNDTDPGGLPLTASLLNQPISGTVTLTPTGSYTYTPPTGFTGVASFCYAVTNTAGLSASTCVSINVSPVPSPGNNPPVANNDATQTTAGVSVTINVVANDTDPDPATTLAGQLSNPTILAQPSSGTVTVVNGQVVFTPPANFTGVVSFPYQICDKATPALCATAVVTVNVQPTPPVGTTLAPVAIDDALLTYVNVPKTGTVAGNDSDPQGLTLTYTTGQPASGTVLMSPTGSYTYTPPTGFVGPTSFTYSVCNTAGKCDVATVSVDVLPSLLPPVATPDIANTNQNTPVTGNVLTNDTDPGGLPLTASLLNQPISGTVTLTPTGSYTYTPPTGFTGVASFCYAVTNTAGLSASTCVSINVSPVPSPGNNPPVANNDATQTTAGVSVTINVVANDTDPDSATSLNGQLNVPVLLGQPSAGTATVSNGQVVFTPPANFTGVVSFPYQICDKATPALCATAVITVNVQPTPPVGTTLAPVAVDDALLTQKDTPKTGTVAANDSDPNTPVLPLTYTSGQPVHGTVVMASNGTYTYTPTTGYSGPDSFTYSVCNTAGKCDVATVSVDVLPSLLPPVATPDIANTNQNTPVTGNVLTNDTDPGGLPLTASLLNQPISGTVTLTPTGSYTYTPPTGFTGVASFCYAVTNTAGLSASTCVSINVNPVPSPGNNAPVANNDATQTTAGVSVTINVVANDTDPDSVTSLNGQLNVPVLLGQPSAGTATVSNAQVVFTPPASFTGVVTFPYQVCDKATPPLCATALVTVNVQPTPPVGTTLAPVAIDDALLTQKDTPKTGTVAANDSDPNTPVLPLTYTSGQPVHGTVVMASNGTYTYTPTTGYSGPDSFTYSVCNTAGKCDVATVSVDVQPATVTNPPVIIGEPIVTEPGKPVTVCMPIIDADRPDSHTATLCGQPSSGTATAVVNNTANTVCITYTPTTTFTGATTVCIQVCDSQGNCTQTIVPITVIPASQTISLPQPPIVVVVPIVTPKDSTAQVCMTITDPNVGDVHSVSVCSPPTKGTATATVNNTTGQVCVTYKPTPGSVGPDAICLIVCDQTGLCNQVIVPVTIVDPTPPGPGVEPPVVTPTPIVTVPSQPVVVCTGISDSPTDSHTATICGQPSSGTVSVGVNNVTHALCVTYTPGSTAPLTTTVCVQVCDQTGQCTTVILPITVLPAPKALLLPHAWLQGALFGVTSPTGVMRDDLRVKKFLPAASPYSNWTSITTVGPVSNTAVVFGVTGNDAIVDWVFVELRSPSNFSLVVDSRPALIQRDGDIVEIDGISPVAFGAAQGSYYVSVKHRNHLGVMTLSALPLSLTGTDVDFRTPATATYRITTSAINQAQVTVAQGVALWAGNVLYDKSVIYQSTGNDVSAVSVQVKGPLNLTGAANYILNGYYTGDVNMDGRTIYQGNGNDVNYIYLNVTKNHPGNVAGQNFFVIKEQLP